MRIRLFEAMELKYWEDDTSQLSGKRIRQDLASMKSFKGKAGGVNILALLVIMFCLDLLQ